MTRHVASRPDTLTGADGNKLAADVFGTGGDIVALLHGGGQTRHAWRRTAEIMARSGMTAYVIDQRGHGDSEWVPSGAYAFSDFAADVHAIAHELAARHGKRAAVAGASLGGIAKVAWDEPDDPFLVGRPVAFDELPARQATADLRGAECLHDGLDHRLWMRRRSDRGQDLARQ